MKKRAFFSWTLSPEKKPCSRAKFGNWKAKAIL